MSLYVESSALLAWLLDEPAAPTVRAALDDADLVFTSGLTQVESQRVLVRGGFLGEWTETEIADRRALLAEASTYWSLIPLDEDVLQRASRPFPGEPVRTLDAIHLASALVAREALAGVALLSLDRRVREAGRELGFEILPA